MTRSYKKDRIDLLKKVYGPWTNTLKWKDDISATMDYCDFCEMYEKILEGFESLSDEPAMWVQMSLNTSYKEWSNKMDKLILRSGENER